MVAAPLQGGLRVEWSGRESVHFRDVCTVLKTLSVVSHKETCESVSASQRFRYTKEINASAGATNRPDALDAALRRAGRFDREIAMSIPSEAARASILRVLTRPLSLSGDFDFAVVAKRTPGFVGADLQVGTHMSLSSLLLLNAEI
jgi:SpoVK/Ycf46/Vps4 family AAA+-type ATPase